MTDHVSVLVVDDSEDLRELLTLVIERDPRLGSGGHRHRGS